MMTNAAVAGIAAADLISAPLPGGEAGQQQIAALPEGE